MVKARGLILIILAIFAVYIAMQDPNGSAGIIRDGVRAAWNNVGDLWKFITALFSGK